MAIAITPEMLGLIDRGDPNDPIARQFVPSVAETEVAPEELADPIGDEARSPVKGIVHRYPDRVLLKPVHVCPVYCRFCFRREKVGPGGEALSAAELEAALAYIRSHPAIWEVILTGGDPLMLAPRRLGELVAALDAIEHVAVIRVHSRVPIVDPGRVTDELVAAIKPRRAALWLGVHCNHARELAPATRAALGRLADAGIPLLGQTVLLAGVNDTVETLDQLMRALVTARVKPYYLHHPDLVRGTGHFRVSIARGQELMRALARPAVGPGAADLRARRAGRPRQGAGRAGLSWGLSRRRSRRAPGQRRVRRDAPLSRLTFEHSVVADRARRLDRELDRPGGRLLEPERHRHLLALCKRRLELDPEVIAARLQRDRRVWRQAEPLLHLLHGDAAAHHLDAVDLDLGRDRALGADQPVGLVRLVGHGEVSTGEACDGR